MYVIMRRIMEIVPDNEPREVAVTKSTESSRSRHMLSFVLAFFFAVAAFFSGFHVGSVSSQGANVSAFFFPQSTKSETVNLDLFWKVWDTLEERFVSSTTTDPRTEEEHVWGAIQGVVNSYGDPYTVFMPPEDTKIFESDIAGEFGGVGMEVGMRDDVLTIIAPLPNTPAQKAGILSGDVLVKIDGKSTEGMSVDQAVSKIRGEKGTSVSLSLYRKDVTELIEVSIVREIINIPITETEEKDGVFIIRLYSFSANSEALMQEALRSFMKSSSDKLVIDLRGNPGGYLQSAVGIGSFFLPTGKVIVRENFGDDKEEQLYRSTGKDLMKYKQFKLVVLVDGGSASASEILAGALKEHGVATLIGTHTFGKGSVQELVDMPGGASLKVTIARWLTPDGTSISDGGLAPDIEVKVTPEDRAAEKDPQEDAAIEFLKK